MNYSTFIRSTTHTCFFYDNLLAAQGIRIRRIYTHQVVPGMLVAVQDTAAQDILERSQKFEVIDAFETVKVYRIY